MGNSEERPRPASKPPNLNQPKDVLQKLLNIELERLDTAVKIERERKIVFPETSVIIHDILRLQNELQGKKPGNSPTLEDMIG